MIKPIIKDYGLNFRSLSDLIRVDKIVIHHTGDEVDDDLSAEEIHRIHLANDWAGIGYHYVIRKNGRIEQGRPEWAIGSHAYGENWHTIGVHCCGNFCIAEPTQFQIESLAYLVGWLCDKYGLIPSDKTVVGHCDINATACPGDNLYDILDVIRGKAIWYMQNYQEGD